MGFWNGSKKKEEKTLGQSAADLTGQILEYKVGLRRVKNQCAAMLEKELRTARALKAKGLKSPSNYYRIGVAWYLQQAVDQAYHRLNEISDTTQLNNLMGELGGMLRQVNQIGQSANSADTGTLFRELEKIQKNAVSEQQEQAKLLKRMNQTVPAQSGIQADQLVGADIIERLINGQEGGLDGIPADAIPLSAAGTQNVRQELHPEGYQQTKADSSGTGQSHSAQTFAYEAGAQKQNTQEQSMEELLRAAQESLNRL